MGYHHLALATRDMKAIDHFYREVMGFDLKKVEIGPTPIGGWAKHFFYEIEPDGESGPSICIDEGEANLYDAAWSLAHKVIALTEENAALRTELTSPNAATRALDEIAAALSAGEAVAVFPEGEMSPDGRLQPFRPWVEQLLDRQPGVRVVEVAGAGRLGGNRRRAVRR